jgi:hypothetical protein
VENQFLRTLDHPGIARLFPAVVADESGRFQLEGIGRERIAIVAISGPTIETKLARVMTRPAQSLQRLEWNDWPSSGHLIYYGASLEHVAGPTTPIAGVVRELSTGKPIAGAIVTSWKLAGDNLHGRTDIHTAADAQGCYLLIGMPRGEGNIIKVHGPEGLPFLDFEKGVPAAQGLETVKVDAELKRGIWIRGRVTDKVTGKPVSASIEYFAFTDNPHRLAAPGLWPRLHTKQDGTFQFIGLPGRGFVAARGDGDKHLISVGADKFKRLDGLAGTLLTQPPCNPGDFHALVEVEPAEDAATLTCNVTLDPGRTFKGTIIGPDGKPLAALAWVACADLSLPRGTGRLSRLRNSSSMA